MEGQRGADQSNYLNELVYVMCIYFWVCVVHLLLLQLLLLMLLVLLWSLSIWLSVFADHNLYPPGHVCPSITTLFAYSVLFLLMRIRIRIRIRIGMCVCICCSCLLCVACGKLMRSRDWARAKFNAATHQLPTYVYNIGYDKLSNFESIEFISC